MTVSQIAKEQIILISNQHGFIYDKRKNYFYRDLSETLNDFMLVAFYPNRPKCDTVAIDINFGVHIQRMCELISNLYEEPVSKTNKFPQVTGSLYGLTGKRSIIYSINDDIEHFKESFDTLFQKNLEPWFQDMHSWKNIQNRILTRIYPSYIVSVTHYFNGDKKKGLKHAIKCLNSRDKEYLQPRDYAFVENFAKLPPYKRDFNIDMMK